MITYTKVTTEGCYVQKLDSDLRIYRLEDKFYLVDDKYNSVYWIPNYKFTEDELANASN